MITDEESIPVDLNPAPYRELTIASAVFGVLLGALLTAAFTYVASSWDLLPGPPWRPFWLCQLRVMGKGPSLKTTSIKRWLGNK